MPTKRPLLDLADRLDGRFRDAFLLSVNRMRRTQRVELERLIAAGDIDGVLRTLGLIGPGSFASMEAAISGAYWASARLETRKIPKRIVDSVLVGVDFTPGNPDAAATLRRYSLNRIREITEETRNGIRAALIEGAETGQGPRAIARKIRSQIGLTARQMRIVGNFDADLADGSPKALRRILGRRLRDKRFDRTILKALKGGPPLSTAQKRTMTKRYGERFLKHRSEAIARTESLRAVTKSQEDAWEEAVNKGVVEQRSIRRFWLTAGDERVRSSHIGIPSLNNAGKRPDEFFVTPKGNTLAFPRDPNGRPEETIQCRCTLTFSVAN